MTTALVLVAGVALAGVGGEVFVRGAVGVAAWARVPAAIIAVTVAAFATSSPELLVSVNAALEDESAIAFGDALGSNVVNVALILGLAIVIHPSPVERDTARRDLPVAVAAPFLALGLAADGSMSRFDGAVILVAFLAWLGVTATHARRARADAGELLGELNRARAAVQLVVGLVLLVVAGRVVVVAAEQIGEALGMNTFVVGATFVAFGTSAPELATTLAAARRGHEEVGLGAIIGSNIFNGLWIIGVLSVLRPFEVPFDEVLLTIVVGALTVVMLIPGRAFLLGRWRGLSLLSVYAAYVTAVVIQGS